MVEEDVVVRVEGDPFGGIEGLRVTPTRYPLEEVELQAPVRPGKIVCVGLNYRRHALEFGREPPEEPLLFLKAPSAVIGPGEPILLPPVSSCVEYEGELVAVVGKRIKNASPAEASAAVLGFTCGNDVTARDLQKKDGQWSRAKSFDTFAPLGPYITTGAVSPEARVKTYLNGRLVQQDTVAGMIFPVQEILSFISRIMTLEPGDVIFTGTPAGVGRLAPGDVVEVEIDGIGRLANPVQKAEV